MRWVMMFILILLLFCGYVWKFLIRPAFVFLWWFYVLGNWNVRWCIVNYRNFTLVLWIYVWNIELGFVFWGGPLLFGILHCYLGFVFWGGTLLFGILDWFCILIWIYTRKFDPGFLFWDGLIFVKLETWVWFKFFYIVFVDFFQAFWWLVNNC